MAKGIAQRWRIVAVIAAVGVLTAWQPASAEDSKFEGWYAVAGDPAPGDSFVGLAQANADRTFRLDLRAEVTDTRLSEGASRIDGQIDDYRYNVAIDPGAHVVTATFTGLTVDVESAGNLFARSVAVVNISSDTIGCANILGASTQLAYSNGGLDVTAVSGDISVSFNVVVPPNCTYTATAHVVSKAQQGPDLLAASDFVWPPVGLAGSAASSITGKFESLTVRPAV